MILLNATVEISSLEINICNNLTDTNVKMTAVINLDPTTRVDLYLISNINNDLAHQKSTGDTVITLSNSVSRLGVLPVNSILKIKDAYSQLVQPCCMYIGELHLPQLHQHQSYIPLPN